VWPWYDHAYRMTTGRNIRQTNLRDVTDAPRDDSA